ncbi:hypothetical protein EJB05_16472 [Eragrostis curvula]|uniref:Uncharacterized protein n=1 Tax=Eragrostis curvula TaxID=38414 RepID=A0A5J9VGN6_9POAL|nr:hypothetical protein EJB05_16472 [Eragrostis curvula]
MVSFQDDLVLATTGSVCCIKMVRKRACPVVDVISSDHEDLNYENELRHDHVSVTSVSTKGFDDFDGSDLDISNHILYNNFVMEMYHSTCISTKTLTARWQSPSAVKPPTWAQILSAAWLNKRAYLPVLQPLCWCGSRAGQDFDGNDLDTSNHILYNNFVMEAHGIENLVLPTRDYLYAPLIKDLCKATDFIHNKN